MLDAVLAEALKLRRHRATWLMVWIYPIAITLILAGVLLYSALSTHGPAGPPQSAADWIQDGTVLWKVPTSGAGRFLIAGFAAVVFAGEYGWNTWKLIIPARARWQLIAAKWVVALGFLMLALIAADLIIVLGSLLLDKIPVGVTVAAVAKAHWQAGAHALLPILYTIAFAGLFAILTQSILATVILSIALVVIEGLWPLIGLFAHQYAPALITWLVKVLPFYHVSNLNAWARGGMDMMLDKSTIVSMSWTTSFWALTAWIVAAGAATQARFLRQDLN